MGRVKAKSFICSCGGTKYDVFSAALLGVLLFSVGLISPLPVIADASGTFTQSDWSGGAAATTATHPGDQSGWTIYSSKDTDLAVVNAGVDLESGTESVSNIHATQADFAPSTDISRSQSTTAEFASGSTPVNANTNGDKVMLAIASLSPAWSVSSSWNAPDVGSYVAPALADLDNDGLVDILIGHSGGIAVGYKNTGSAAAPAWSYTSAWNAPDIGSYAAPALADLDGDGDLDLLMGSNVGITYGYENIGNNTAPTWSYKSTWNAPDVGGQANPSLADLDGDGDFDLLIGESGGYVKAYENTGSASAPVWTANSGWDTNIDVGTWSSTAAADLDGDGDVDLMVGNSTGFIYGIENTGSSSAPTWTSNASWPRVTRVPMRHQPLLIWTVMATSILWQANQAVYRLGMKT